jgi:hypothetical protein
MYVYKLAHLCAGLVDVFTAIAAPALVVMHSARGKRALVAELRMSRVVHISVQMGFQGEPGFVSRAYCGRAFARPFNSDPDRNPAHRAVIKIVSHELPDKYIHIGSQTGV